MPKKQRNRQPDMAWEDWYLLARHYFEEHGDLLIPKDYVCPTGEELGRWIERQRAKYNRVPTINGMLDDVQIAYLDRIGMVWKLEKRRGWDEWLSLLDSYAAEHGNIDVPHDYARGGAGLGDWLVKQRLHYAAGELSEREIAALETRGVNWQLRTKPRSWDDWFADAEEYYRAHGHLLVHLEDLTADGGKLGYWIYKQRDIYMGRKPGQSLTREQIERLSGIGMVWEPMADAWESMYRTVAASRAEHRRLPLWPRGLKSPDGRSMSGWIGTQRQNLAAGKLPADRVQKLALLGILPAQPKAG